MHELFDLFVLLSFDLCDLFDGLIELATQLRYLGFGFLAALGQPVELLTSALELFAAGLERVAFLGGLLKRRGHGPQLFFHLG